MKDFVVYILWSARCQKTYVGFTSNLIARFASHNQLAKKGYTLRSRPWKVVSVEFFQSKKEAMERERFLKSGKGRDWIKGNIQSEC